METGFLILSISCLSGFIYLIIGYLLSFKQKADVLNGIDFSKISDLPAFCKYVGNSFLLSCVVLILAGVLVYLAYLNLLLFIAIFVFFSVLPIINVVKAMRKFQKSAS
ncbi:hypothetical protein Q4574_13190 [Aliiglaciecola sp. 3_MG-2023]|uniref:hypothetical protein n=1 Tax=Aliiglaciecola sp. 3_MG-2023 TaxID=3062644 RepID=UPI0026E31592|nr:hypothetical protein [Aliiglaciecola sp. 3_MG-2023]MDO6694242.1 hypothetical protein [Aliiglaciecola sp. 3_MG-2023]